MYHYIYNNVEYSQFFLGRVEEGLIFRHQGGDIYLIVTDVDKDNEKIEVERFNRKANDGSV